jgi:osmoprotectant transport system ATP-binding protein
MDVRKLRRSMGYAIQGVGLFPHMTVAQNVAVVPRLLGWDTRRTSARVDELLEMVGLASAQYGRRFPQQLSGGEAQRVGVARALAADPPVLLMDEPFGAVDPLTRERLQTEFLAIQDGLRKTVLLVTHDLDEAIRLTDRLAIMEAGRLVQYDTPEAVLAKPANQFVKDFVGTDRSLRRLSRRLVAGVMRPAVTVGLDDSPLEALSGRESYRCLWVVNEHHVLVGWADGEDLLRKSSVAEAAHMAAADDISVRDTASLRDALSRMLGLGFRYLPVVDGQGLLLGELALSDVEKGAREAEP